MLKVALYAGQSLILLFALYGSCSNQTEMDRIQSDIDEHKVEYLLLRNRVLDLASEVQSSTAMGKETVKDIRHLEQDHDSDYRELMAYVQTMREKLAKGEWRVREE